LICIQSFVPAKSTFHENTSVVTLVIGKTDKIYSRVSFILKQSNPNDAVIPRRNSSGCRLTTTMYNLPVFIFHIHKDSKIFTMFLSSYTINILYNLYNQNVIHNIKLRYERTLFLNILLDEHCGVNLMAAMKKINLLNFDCNLTECRLRVSSYII